MTAPGSASRMCHISVLPRGPSSPSSGCTWTDSRSEVKISFTSSGSSCSARNQASPIGSAESGNQGARRVLPHTFSRRDGVSRTGAPMLGMADHELVDPVEPALQLLHRSGVGEPDMLFGPERLARNHRHLGLA